MHALRKSSIASLVLNVLEGTWWTIATGMALLTVLLLGSASLTSPATSSP